MPKKEKVHRLEVSVSFDKPIKRAEAVKEFRNCVKPNDFYVGSFSDAEVMKVKSVSSKKTDRQAIAYGFDYWPY